MTILRNAAECARCGDEIESRHGHDFVSCSCGAIAVDGGRSYLRRSFKELSDLIERSEFSEDHDEEVMPPAMGR